MVLLNTFKLKHLPNKLTRYSSMNVVTSRIIIVVQVFQSHEIKKKSLLKKSTRSRVAVARACTRSYTHRELSSLLLNRYFPGPHVHLSVHVSGYISYLRWPTTVTQNQMLTSNSNRSHQIQIAHSKFKSLTANYKSLTANYKSLTANYKSLTANSQQIKVALVAHSKLQIINSARRLRLSTASGTTRLKIFVIHEAATL